jgi:hypothetical protein
MQEQGFYRPHIKVSQTAKREHSVVNGKIKVKFNVGMELSVCLLAPTKKDFVNALLYI